MKTNSFIKAHGMWVVALLTAGITMSFQMAEKDLKTEDVVYHYIGNSVHDQFNDVNMWSITNDSNPCVELDDDLPCKITLPEGVTLSSELGSKSNSAVLLRSEGYKQVQ